MTEAIGLAYGKVILLGEHAVVYGAPALAAGIERGARARARRSAGESSLALGGREHAGPGEDRPTPGGSDVARAFGALLAAMPGAPAVRVEAESDLAPGGGLGSSAALAVAIASAVDALASGERAGDAETEDAERARRVLAAAGAWELVFHGNPSGIDTAAAALGGCLRFTRGDGATPLAPRDDLWLCVGSTGTASSTREMVEGVARLFERKPALAERSLAGITALVDNAALAIEAGDLVGLGRLMDLNHMILAGMFLSTEAIEVLCALAREAGALGAKLTGAGGGGSIIALLPPAPGGGAGGPMDTAERVLAAWRSAGFSGFVTRVRRAPGRGSSP